jgi:hypothetical protein
MLLKCFVQFLFCQLLYVLFFTLILFFLVLLKLICFANCLLDPIMNFYQGLVNSVLSEKVILVFTTAHKESLKDQVESFIASELVKACS